MAKAVDIVKRNNIESNMLRICFLENVFRMPILGGFSLK